MNNCQVGGMYGTYILWVQHVVTQKVYAITSLLIVLSTNILINVRIYPLEIDFAKSLIKDQINTYH